MVVWYPSSSPGDPYCGLCTHHLSLHEEGGCTAAGWHYDGMRNGMRPYVGIRPCGCGATGVTRRADERALALLAHIPRLTWQFVRFVASRGHDRKP